MRKKKISVRAIASECGVAVGTVSRVINNKPGVREDLRDKVLAAVKRHNYNPYVNVPLVNNIRTRSLRVVMPFGGTGGFDNSFYAKGLEGIKKVAVEKGYDLTITDETRLEAEFSTHRDSRLPNTAEGILFFCPHRGWDLQIDKVKEWGIPVALVNRPTAHKDIIVVKEKDRGVIIGDMVDYLLSLGHRRFGYVSSSRGNIIHNDENVRQAMDAHGMEILPEHFIRPDDGLEERLQGLIAENALPDVFLCIGDMVAIGVLKTLQKLGARVPQDVALVGYNNIDTGMYTTPELTTIDNHIENMSSFAIKLLIERIEGAKFSSMETEFAAELVIRESCGCKLVGR